MRLTISAPTKAKLPRAKLNAIKKSALGDSYRLNLVVTTPALIKKMNLIYRGLNKPTDILSFPLSKREGEIYICPSEARKEAKKFARPYDNFFIFLFIHGCAHLKGHDHGATMERLEEKLRRKFHV